MSRMGPPNEHTEADCLRCRETFGSWFALQCHLRYFEDHPGAFHEPVPIRTRRGRPRTYDDEEHRKDARQKRRRYARRVTPSTSANPHRIQRQRTKGWRMPEGAVYVGRPARWGNPFGTRDWGNKSIVLYRNAILGYWQPTLLADEPDWRVEQAYRTHNQWRVRMGREISAQVRDDLRGRDLACWCPLDQPCHADVLLELANPQDTQEEAK